MKTQRQLSRLLLGVALLSFPGLAATLTDHMVTKAVSTSGCTVPAAATAFLTTDQSVWLWFNVTGANAGDVASATWYSPNGAAYNSTSWNPLASAGTWCYWSSINVAGYPPASSPGNWSVRVSWNGSSLFSLNFTILAPTIPSITTGGVVNAASYASGGAVAPGSIASAFGSFLLTSPAGAAGVPLPTSLSGLSMQFGSGTKVPLIYAANGQVNFQVPWELAGLSQSSLTATFSGQASTAQNVSLAPFAPGIFSTNAQGFGQGAILDPTYKLVDTSNPAAPGSTVVLIYCTGLGAVSNQPASGAPSPSNPPATTTTTPTVMIGGAPAQVSFSGLAPGFVGEYQVNALVPPNSAAGDAVPVVISIGGKTSNTVTMAVKAAPVNPNATLTSISPTAGNAGQILTVVLNGLNTNFIPAQTLASFGPGISVAGAPEGQPGVLTVASPTSATGTLMIDPAAATGTRNVTVTAGTQTLSLNNAFTVLAAPVPMGPLVITSTSPANGATGVSLTPTIQIVFNEPLDPATVGPSTFGFASGKTILPATVAYDSTKNLVSLAPAGVLSPQTTYTVTVGALVRNAVENPLGTASTFSFSTIPPATVSGVVTAPAGISPATLTVLSFGGKTSTPSTGGNFTASLNPTGVGLVAAMVPGKDFGLLAATVGGAAATVSSPSVAAPGRVAADLAIRTMPPGVYRTRWQVTASPLAAIAPNTLVADLQTTAEMLTFMSPYLFTADPQRAPTILSAIAANPATGQFAQVLAQNVSKTDPLTDPAVQSAAQNAIAAVVQALAKKAVGPSLLSPEPNAAESASVQEPNAPAGSTSLSAMLAVTPYCWPGLTPPAGGGLLPCLDLDYISFPAGSISVDQLTGGYGFTAHNCTGNSLFSSRLFGCAIGWLVQVKLIPRASDGGNPATIVAATGGAYGPASPIGQYDSSSCGPTSCYSAWVSGNSWFQYISPSNFLVSAVAWALSRVDPLSAVLNGPSFSLPPSFTDQMDYIARFYSGAIGDSWENANMAAYTGGPALTFQAYMVNLLDEASNVLDALETLMPVPGTTPLDDLEECALKQTALELLNAGTAIGNTHTGASGFVDTVRTVAVDLCNNLAQCLADADLKAGLDEAKDVSKHLVQMGGKALKWVPVAGVVIETLDVTSSLGQAAQRGLEWASLASPIETAVISIKPGPSSVLNPLPSITSLSPSSAPVGASAQTVSIRGNYLLTTSTVAVSNIERSFTVGNDYGLTITLNSSDLAQAGPLMVAVTNPAPGGGTSEAIFMVGTGSFQPKVTSLNPSSAVVGANLPVLTVLGEYFLPNPTVTLNGSPRSIATPSDAGRLTVTLNKQDLTKAGVFPVVVTNPGGTASNALNFTVLDAKPAQPAVLSVSTTKRVYLVNDQFSMGYTTLAGAAAGTFDLMIQFLSLASGNTYYYYDDPSDSNNEWIHSAVRAAWTGTPQTGGPFTIPAAGASAFQVTSDVPSGDYHIKAYFSKAGANQPVGAVAETDFSVATSTSPGGCFVATAAFGSPMAYQVRWLRGFRDRILLSGRVGRAFVNWYYGWSPRAAAWLRGHAVVRKLTRAVLWIPVAFAWSSLRTSVACASLGLLVLLFSLGWSLRRGPAWWKGICLLLLAIGVASAQAPPCKPLPELVPPTRVTFSTRAFRPQGRRADINYAKETKNANYSDRLERRGG
jgi:uncharacterized protein (TIGR03437 family)